MMLTVPPLLIITDRGRPDIRKLRDAEPTRRTSNRGRSNGPGGRWKGMWIRLCAAADCADRCARRIGFSQQARGSCPRPSAEGEGVEG